MSFLFGPMYDSLTPKQTSRKDLVPGFVDPHVHRQGRYDYRYETKSSVPPETTIATSSGDRVCASRPGARSVPQER